MKEVDNNSPSFLGCRFDRWRSIRCTRWLKGIEIVGSAMIMLIWFYYTVVEKAFWQILTDGRALLVDVLLGIPLVIAMGLVGVIVWMGCVRWLCCVLGFGKAVDDELSDGF